MSALRQVMIATPSYDGKVTAGFTLALTDTIVAAAGAGILCRWNVVRGVPLLPIARNRLVMDFLDSDCDDLVMIDADVRWWPKFFIRLLGWDKDIVGGAYPFKRREESYPVKLETDDAGRLVQCPDTGLLEAIIAPTGFLRIRRAVFPRMIEALGGEDALRVIEDIKDGGRRPDYLCLFDTSKRGNTWLGEDAEFCRRWREECGGKIWIDPEMDFEHSGIMEYAGNMGEHLRAGKAGQEEEASLSIAG